MTNSEEERQLSNQVKIFDPTAHCIAVTFNGMVYYRVVLNGVHGNLMPFSVDAWEEAWKIVQCDKSAKNNCNAQA